MLKYFLNIDRKKFAFLNSPLALLVLGACGGGGGSISSGPPGGSSSSTVGGNVVKGPLSNALVGLDYDGDGFVDSATVRTGTDGSYSLKTTSNIYTVIAVADDTTIDTSSGTVLSGVTLKAPQGASVVSPTTTLIEEASITKEQVVEILGLPDGVDPLTFNPYANGVNAADALAVEKASQQIMSVVNAFAGAAEGSGATEAEAFNAALNSVIEIVKTKATNLNEPNASAADKTLDLTNTADLALVKAKVVTKVAAETSANTTAFNALADDTVAALKNVNAKIATVSDLSSDAAKNTFSTTQVLADQLKTAGEAEVVSVGSGSIDFTDATKVDTAAANKAPTDIALSKSAIAEDASSLVIGTLTTADSDQTSGVLHTYKIAELAGTDFAAFSIDALTGDLSFKAQPDFETKSSYSIVILSTDEGGKTYSCAFTITVTDVNEAPVFASATDTASVVENAAATTVIYTASATDIDAPSSITYSISGGTDAALVEVDSTSGEVTLKSSANYEVKSSYAFTVSASDGSLTDAIDVTVNVSDVVELRGGQFSSAELSVSSSDTFDVTAPLEAVGYLDDRAFEDGYLTLKQVGLNVELYIDPDGDSAFSSKLLTVTGTGLDQLSASTFGQTGSLEFSYLGQSLSSLTLSSETQESLSTLSNISGTTRSETLTGTSNDDVIDSGGGDDIVDGGGGSDTLLIYEPYSDFTVTTLAGVTRIVGDYTAGNYAYDEIISTNVESVQFSDQTITLEVNNNVTFVNENSTIWSGGLQDDIVFSLGGDQILNANGGDDTFIIFGVSSDYRLLKTEEGNTIVSARNYIDQHSFGQKDLRSFEAIQFVDTSVDISYRGVQFLFDDLTLVEGGAPLDGLLSLTREPTSPVTITLSSSEDISMSSDSFIFTPINWETPQEISLIFEDNQAIDDFDNISVHASLVSDDANYHGLDGQSLQLNVLDNDIPTVGSIGGTVWLDVDRDGVIDTSETAVQLGVAYLDLNLNGVRDHEEPNSIVDTTGAFEFSNLKPGSYSVGLELPKSHDLTFPAPLKNDIVNLVSSGENGSVELSGKDLSYHTAYQEVIEADSIIDDFGYDGTGQTIVVLDTGIDLDHRLFGEDVDNNGIADKIIFSYDFSSETDGSAADANGHGTHVAGIIGATADDYPGVAPGASIIALQVLTASGRGSGSGLESALQWCVENAQEYGITAINMSLGFGNNSDVAQEWFLTDEMLALHQLGVAVVSASGNSYTNFQEPGVSYPSSDPFSLSVGATFHSDVGSIFGANTSVADQIAPFSQRDPELTTTFAPGVLIPSAWYDGSIKSISGTSMAAPVVTGAIAVIQEAAESTLGRRLSVDEVIEFLTTQGDSIFDGDNEDDGLVHTEATYARLNIENLVVALEEMAAPGFHRLDLSAGDALSIKFGVVEDTDSEFDSIAEGSSIIVGSSFDDFIVASAGDDIVRAGLGDDLVIGNGGADNLDGGAGNDVYIVSGAGSQVNVGLGFDKVILDVDVSELQVSDFAINNSSSIQISLNEGDASSNLLVGSNDVIDILRGVSGDDELYGYSSSDFLFGGSGRDKLWGGTGNDFLFSGQGGGILNGGAGADHFVFLASDLSVTGNKVLIADFEVNVDSLLVVLDTAAETISIEPEFGHQKVYFDGENFADVTLAASTHKPSESFSIETIEFVNPDYFDSLESFLSTDFV